MFRVKLSRAEEITSEVRKLVFTCRSLEAQLQQSVPKKIHQEVVAKMQANIDSLSADLVRTKEDELEKAAAIGQRVATLEGQVGSQNETISSQSKTIDSLTVKLSESAIVAMQFSQALSKIQELETRISSMVDFVEYTSAQKRCAELEQQVSNMVPKDQYSALQTELANSVPVQKYVELQKSFELMVSREQFNVAQSRIAELEKTLSESVPKSDFEELAGKITQITKEAIELANRASAAIGYESPAPVEVDPVAALEPDATSAASEVSTLNDPTYAAMETPTVAVEVTQPEVHHIESEVATPAPEFPAAEPVATPQPFRTETQTPAYEIAEVQSQLSEISAAIETGATSVASVPSPMTVEAEKGFRFSNTEFCARSGMEFLEDLEKVDLSVVAAHCQSGDFERWFKDVLADETSAQYLQKIRESNASGEELRTMMVAAIAPRYRA